MQILKLESKKKKKKKKRKPEIKIRKVRNSFTDFDGYT